VDYLMLASKVPSCVYQSASFIKWFVYIHRFGDNTDDETKDNKDIGRKVWLEL